MNEPPPELLEQIIQIAKNQQAHTGCDWKTAVRRVVGTAEWKSDAERIRAAEAKRERKLARRRAL